MKMGSSPFAWMAIVLSVGTLATLSLLADEAAKPGLNPLAAGDFTIGPNYVVAPEFTVRQDVPKGALQEFTMNSADSKIYPGIAKNKPGTVPYQRKVCVYIPEEYVAGTAAPLLVVQDGMGYKNFMPVMLDNMIGDQLVTTARRLRENWPNKRFLIESSGGIDETNLLERAVNGKSAFHHSVFRVA